MCSVASPDVSQPLMIHCLGNVRSAGGCHRLTGAYRHQHLQPVSHGRSLIPLGIHSHRLSACWQSGSAVRESLTDNNPWLWFHLAKHSVTRTRRRRGQTQISCEHNMVTCWCISPVMTATEIEHSYMASETLCFCSHSYNHQRRQSFSQPWPVSSYSQRSSYISHPQEIYLGQQTTAKLPSCF